MLISSSPRLATRAAQALAVVSEIVVLVEKANEAQLARIERNVRDVTSLGFKTIAKNAVDTELRRLMDLPVKVEKAKPKAGITTTKPMTAAQANTFVKNINTAITDAAWSGPIVFAAVDKSYKLIKKTESIRAGLVPAFTLVDQRAVKNLSRGYSAWIKGYPTNGLSESIKRSVSTYGLKSGLGRREAGRILMDDMYRQFNIPINTAPPDLRRALGPRIPKKLWPSPPAPVVGGYTGTPDDYFSGLAANQINLSRNFATVETLGEAGAQKYIIVAVLDERTSKVCKEMNGQVFDVSDGLKFRDDFLGAKTPSAVKGMAKWRTPKQTAGLKGKGSGALVKAGMSMPPFHFKCRTKIRMFEDEAGAITAPPKKTKPQQGTKKPAKPKPQTPPTAKKPKKPKKARRSNPGDGPYDFDNMLKELAKGKKAFAGKSGETVRREVNAFLRDQGFVNSDLRSRLAATHNMAVVEKIQIGEMQAVGAHYHNGLIEIREDYLEALIRAAKKGNLRSPYSTTGQSATSTLLHEVVHSHSPMSWNAKWGIGRVLEEATTENATIALIEKMTKGQITRSRRRDGNVYAKYRAALRASIQNSINKAVKKLPAARQEAVKRALNPTLVSEDSSLAFRKRFTKTGRQWNSPKSAAKEFAETASDRVQELSGFELTEEELEVFVTAFRKDMKREIVKKLEGAVRK